MRRLLAGAITALTVTAALALVSGLAPGAATAAPGCPWARPPAPLAKVHIRKVGHLTIGSIGLKTPVFQGRLPDIQSEASRTLMHGPAFYPRSMKWKNGRTNSLPGQGGTVAMLGHRTTRTHPFCLLAKAPVGSYAVLKVRYGTFVYRKLKDVIVPGNNWSVFEHPARYDRHPHRWKKGIKPEYLVAGACDPPGSAALRDDAVFKLVEEWGH